MPEQQGAYSVNERLRAVETEIKNLGDNVRDNLRDTRETIHQQGDEAQRSRDKLVHSVNELRDQTTSLLTKIGAFKEVNDLLIERVEKHEDKTDTRLKPLETDHDRRSFLRSIILWLVPSCAAVFAFAWHEGALLISWLASLKATK